MKVLVLFLSLLLPVREESEALKARVATLLDLTTKRSMVAALAYVDEDSKDAWLNVWKNGFLPYQIMDVQISGDEARVMLQVERRMPFLTGDGEALFKVPLQLDFVRKNDQWLARLPKPDNTIVTPFGFIVQSDPAPQESQPGFSLSPYDLDQIKQTMAHPDRQSIPENGTSNPQGELESKPDSTVPVNEGPN